jgi:hypothetical protein
MRFLRAASGVVVAGRSSDLGGVIGSTDRTGHLAWLQKQNWQLLEFGEKEYEETKV